MDRRDKALLAAIIAAALALCAVIAATRPKEPEAPPSVPPANTQDAQPTDPQEPEAPEESGPAPSDLWSDDGSLHRLKPLDVAIDSETQWAIYRACDYDPGLFCLVMAIADHESGFDPQTVGDNGGSIGIMQINVKWHTGRMEALGVTDLTDPVQCAIVGIDYLRELVSRYGFEPESETLLMAYNMGPSGARAAIKEGRTSTSYSREIMTVYRGYLEELGGGKQ